MLHLYGMGDITELLSLVPVAFYYPGGVRVIHRLWVRVFVIFGASYGSKFHT